MKPDSQLQRERDAAVKTASAVIQQLGEVGVGSRDLSDSVLLALGWTVRGASGGPQLWFTPSGKAWKKKRPSPTESVDDAIGIIPQNEKSLWWQWLLDKRPFASGPRNDGYRAEVFPQGSAERTDHWGPTPALALCIAALMQASKGLPL